MEAGNVNEFLDCFTYQSVAVMYKGRKYFTDGVCFDKSAGIYSFAIDEWNDKNEFVRQVLKAEAATVSDCLELFEEAAIWDGKTFWEAEGEMVWVDW